ncbi:MAG TPA: twin-arginine translocase TatA/TatE family subunit [Chthonomonadaceae bacterium]|nr:twin-arginine translocase TatA/TatE family subunit [Chthonomonadaceae bacterium]
MLAFIDSPIQIMVVMIVVLLVFGPEKMKDIGKQLGRAIREVRRAGSDFRNTLEGEDNRYDNDYRPTGYDSYGNATDTHTDYSAHYNLPSVSEEDLHPAIAAAPEEPAQEQHGDFAAAALSDSSEYPTDYGAARSPETPASNEAVYGVMSRPEHAVPREKSGAQQQ